MKEIAVFERPGRDAGHNGQKGSLRRFMRGHGAFLAVLAIGALIRAICVEGKPYEYDIFMFRDWAVIIHDQGLGAVLHARDQDYIGYHYILGLAAELYALAAGSGWRDDYLFLHVLKVPGTIADLGIVGLLYMVTADLVRRHPDHAPAWLGTKLTRIPGAGGDVARGFGLLAAALYAFNPGVIYATSYWGQLDSFPTFFMLAALAAVLSRRLTLAWMLLTVGFILKPQAVILFPLLGVLTLRDWGFRGVLPAALATLAAMAAGYAYFIAIGEGRTVYTIYEGIFTDDTVKVSTSAWNVWWPSRVFANPLPSDTILGAGRFDLTFTLLSQILTGFSGFLALAYAWRSRSPWHAYIAAAFLAFSFFMLPMKIHERYLFPIFALMAPVAVQNRGASLVYLALSLTFAANLFGVYQIFYGEFFKQRDVALLCTAVNVACYVAFAASMVRGLVLPRRLRSGSLRTQLKKPGAIHAS